MVMQRCDSPSPVSLPPIVGRYLLVTCIECYCDRQGRRYIDSLWRKDLLEHFTYIKQFVLASPCSRAEPPTGCVRIDNDPAFAGVEYVDLPAPRSFGAAIRALPASLKTLWGAIAKADIVHTGVAGWPIPPGWLVTPIARLQNKFYIIVVESAFWRLKPSAPASAKTRFMAHLSEWLNRRCVNSANFTIFTQDEYRQSLLKRPQTGHVIHASWIDEFNILSEERAIEQWQHKMTNQQPLKILFAGRLIADKGVRVLLEAMQSLSADRVPVQLDILGQGDLLGECEALQKTLQSPTEIRLLGTVDYGPDLFRLIQNYHAIVVPSISDEQPRIVYDAYSQATPIIASSTPGLQDCVKEGKTGYLVPPSHPAALAALLKSLSYNPQQLSQMAHLCLQTAHSLTHQEMHLRRWKLLLEVLDSNHIARERQ